MLSPKYSFRMPMLISIPKGAYLKIPRGKIVIWNGNLKNNSYQNNAFGRHHLHSFQNLQTKKNAYNQIGCNKSLVHRKINHLIKKDDPNLINYESYLLITLLN